MVCLTLICRRLALVASLSLATPLWSAEAAKESPPDNAGPVKVLAASWIGGAGDDAVSGVAFAADGSPLLAVNAADLPVRNVTTLGLADAVPAPAPAKKGQKAAPAGPPLCGHVLRLSEDGQKVTAATRLAGSSILRMQADAAGNVYVLADAPAGVRFDTVAGRGRFILCLAPDLRNMRFVRFHDNASDFGLDGNGELVVLAGAKMTRYSAEGSQEKWTAGWKCYGDNRPGGMAVCPETGIAAVVGYGMTKTGHEPYKDPYGYGLDRGGQPAWGLWNPDPKRECDAKFGGNGLMADTTGAAAFPAGDGRVYLVLKADGGNSVCTRNPQNPDEKIDAKVFDGVYQKGAGYGFKGASSTAVIFRVNTKTGELEKGTWMCAWLTPARANGLAISAAAGDGKGGALVVGNSASGCPTKTPWYAAPEGGYKGGGFLAIFDADFKMLQCGYFPGSSIKCVASRNGAILIGGSAAEICKGKDPAANDQEFTYPVPLFKPLQNTYGGGEHDGYFVLLKAQ